MKKIILFSILLIVSACGFGQQTNSISALTKQDYLKKSKNKKTRGWVLLGAGATIAILGFSSDIGDGTTAMSNSNGYFNPDYSESGATVIGVFGLAGMAGSTLFFISARKNKKRSIGLSLKSEPATQLLKNSFVNRSVSSLNLKISL